MMTCPICGSNDIRWNKTILENEEEGYEGYACSNCRSTFELGIRIIEFEYTGKDDVCPFEQE